MSADAAAIPPPISLVPPGEREVVEEAKANEFVAGWKKQLEEHKKKVLEASGKTEIDDNIVLCDKISLTNKSYTAGAAVQIAKFLTESEDGKPSIASKITIADLSDIIASRMEDEGLQVLQTICDAFTHSKLIEVDLSDNAMGSKGIKACCAVLSGQAGSLERLSLCNNGLSGTSMQEVADILAGDADEDNVCERLTKIHFFNNMSGDEGCNAFARILSRCTERLTDVRFSGTRAGSEGSILIASILEGMGEEKVGNIERLDLADNSFGTEGAGNLGTALGRCNKLKYLNLRDCLLEDEGTGIVCRALWSADAPIEHLDISGNEVTRHGAKSIAELIEENETLKVLHAEENELTSLGVKTIAAALGGGLGATKEEEADSSDDEGPKKISIEEICLGTNECGRIGGNALIRAYGEDGKNIPSLKKINLDGNMFPADIVESLKEAFGDKLGSMEDNDDDEDVDEDIDEDADEDEDEREDQNDINAQESVDVHKLAEKIAGVKLDNLC